MGQLLSIVVFFGNDLPEEEFLVDEMRKSRLEEGIQQINAQVDGLHVANRNAIFCSATLNGPRQAIERLKDLLESSHIGSYEYDSSDVPAFRAAQNHN